jgi:hypothetical protein
MRERERERERNLLDVKHEAFVSELVAGLVCNVEHCTTIIESDPRESGAVLSTWATQIICGSQLDQL